MADSAELTERTIQTNITRISWNLPRSTGVYRCGNGEWILNKEMKRTSAKVCYRSTGVLPC